ncbi:MAG TPA: hypothetical protein VMM13_00785, partial [Euzebya sp.]|nr:hypothetical protein [Euzebya sp.]
EDAIIDQAAAEIIAEGDALAAEMWASTLAAAMAQTRQQGSLAGQAIPPFEELLLARCAQRKDPGAAVVASALAALAEGHLRPHAQTTARVCQAAATGLPRWVADIGRAQPTGAWQARDVFGDQTSIAIHFQRPTTGQTHSLIALIDHNLSGQAKDLWLAADAREAHAQWRQAADTDPHMVMRDVPVKRAMTMLRDALAMSDQWDGDADLRTEEFAQHRALAWARVRDAGLDTRRDQAELSRQERDDVVAAFMANGAAEELANAWPDVDVEILVSHIVDLRADAQDRPLRFSPMVVGEMLVDTIPRRVVLDTAAVEALPDVLAAFVTFAAARSGLEAPFVKEILDAIDSLAPSIAAQMRDPSVASPAKAVVGHLLAQGVDLEDSDAASAVLADLDPMDLPIGGMPPIPQPPANPPVAITEAVSQTVGLIRLNQIAEFFGEGRKLTKTGQPTLADARVLVPLLGTADRLDEQIGERTFKTKSAKELRELAFTLRWAVAAGAIRKQHGRYHAAATWQKLADKPLQRWRRAAEALWRLGPLEAFHDTSWGSLQQLAAFVDELVPVVCAGLLTGPQDVEEVAAMLADTAGQAFDFGGSYLGEPQHRLTSFTRDVDILLRVLGWAGITERHGGTIEADAYARGGTRVVGGHIHLTDAGRWWAARTVHQPDR